MTTAPFSPAEVRNARDDLHRAANAATNALRAVMLSPAYNRAPENVRAEFRNALAACSSAALAALVSP